MISFDENQFRFQIVTIMQSHDRTAFSCFAVRLIKIYYWSIIAKTDSLVSSEVRLRKSRKQPRDQFSEPHFRVIETPFSVARKRAIDTWRWSRYRDRQAGIFRRWKSVR